ncbi:MAG TPA: carboxypeptidase-like regulatory domain-containing protein, partial [Hymenobacter sp.]
TLAAPTLAPANASAVQVFTGTTTDAHGQALPYVSLGVVGGNQGTVSRSDGTFTLRLQGVKSTATVRLSCVGYQSREWHVSALSALARGKNMRLALREQQTALPEVVVQSARPVRRVLGNTTKSTFFNAGFGSAESGAQIGVPIHVGKRPVYLEQVTVHISYNRYDSLLLRLNVYRLERGVPTKTLLPEQVLLQLGNQIGPVTFNLAPRLLPVAGNILVSVELLEGWGGPAKGLFLSAGSLNGPTYYRRTSEAAWRRARGMGVGIQATAVLAVGEK